MNENIEKDVQEVKRRLEFIGENNVDEAVICDLLNSFHTDSAVDSVMDIILSTSNNRCSEEQAIPVESEGPNASATVSTKAEKETKKDDNTAVVEDYIDLSMDNTPIEIDDTTDTEDDDDTYYNHGNWDDISYIDNASRSLSPALMNVCDDNEAPRQVANELANTTEEILEENNNDPNNNMESIERHEEVPTCSSNIEREPYQENTIMQVDSPQPGCSKDMDRDEYMDDDKLRKEALKICDLLTNLGYTLVYNTLLKNARAENRIELTIWDLLPEKRPDPQYALKRKYSDDDGVLEQSSTSINTFTPKDNNVKNQDGISTSCEEPKKDNFKKLFNPFNSTSKSTLFSSPSKSNVDIWNSSTKQGSNTKEESNLKSTVTPVSSSVSSKEIKLKKPKLISPDSIISSSSVSKENSSVAKFNLLRQPVLNLIDQNSSNQQSASYVGNQQLIFNVTNNQPVNQSYKTLVVRQNQLKQLTNLAKNHINSAPHRNTVIRPSRLIYNASLPQVIKNGVSSGAMLPTPQTLPNKSCIVKVAGTPTKGTDPIQLAPLATSSNMFFNFNNKSYCLVPVGTKNKSGKASPSQTADCSATPSTSSASCSTLPSTSTIEESHPTSSTSVSTSSSTDLSRTVATTSTDVTPILPPSEDVSSVINLNEVSSCGSSQLDDSKKLLKNTQKVLTARASRMADKLISMFPQVDAAYVKQICAFTLEHEKLAGDDELLNRLTEHLLQKMAATPPVQETVPEEVAIEEQYANLIGIFPDADPTYLRQTAEELHNKPEELRQFIQCKLENRNYPTREEYYAKQKITQQQKQYTTDFNIQQFLEIFPDPFQYFEDPSRQCRINTDALEFLKFHFNRIKVATIMSYYSRYKYHLTLTAKAVEQLRPDVKGKRTRVPYTPQNIPLLQEIAFIVHKEEITNYLNNIKARELQEFLEYKRNNELLQCLCCYDDECMPSKCSRCENDHVFCNSCIVRGTEAKLANGETRIGCFTECTSEFSLSVLRRVLPPTKFSIILRKKQEAEVMAAGLEGLVTCPFCHFASIPPPEDKIFKCLNPECMKETCRLCKELNHVPLKCEEAKSDKARHYLEEKMTEALVRKCYRCGRPFFKEDGCNKIYCVCGAMMCYICDKPIKGYTHFNQGNAAQSNLCPLWSDRSINAAAVTKVAEETLKHIQQQDPNVRLSTKGLLPGVPARNHGQVEPAHHSTTLPVRAYKIARFDS